MMYQFTLILYSKWITLVLFQNDSTKVSCKPSKTFSILLIVIELDLMHCERETAFLFICSCTSVRQLSLFFVYTSAHLILFNLMALVRP